MRKIFISLTICIFSIGLYAQEKISNAIDLSKALKIDPRLLSINKDGFKDRALLFTILVGVNNKGIVDSILINHSPELDLFLNYLDVKAKIRKIDFSFYKGKKICFPILLRDMNDDYIKNGLTRFFDQQWETFIPSNINNFMPNRTLIIYKPQVLSYLIVSG